MTATAPVFWEHAAPIFTGTIAAPALPQLGQVLLLLIGVGAGNFPLFSIGMKYKFPAAGLYVLTERLPGAPISLQAHHARY